MQVLKSICMFHFTDDGLSSAARPASDAEHLLPLLEGDRIVEDLDQFLELLGHNSLLGIEGVDANFSQESAHENVGGFEAIQLLLHLAQGDTHVFCDGGCVRLSVMKEVEHDLCGGGISKNGFNHKHHYHLFIRLCHL